MDMFGVPSPHLLSFSTAGVCHIIQKCFHGLSFPTFLVCVPHSALIVHAGARQRSPFNLHLQSSSPYLHMCVRCTRTLYRYAMCGHSRVATITPVHVQLTATALYRGYVALRTRRNPVEAWLFRRKCRGLRCVLDTRLAYVMRWMNP